MNLCPTRPGQVGGRSRVEYGRMKPNIDAATSGSEPEQLAYDSEPGRIPSYPAHQDQIRARPRLPRGAYEAGQANFRGPGP
jgi:hypothetical protein